MTNATEPLLYFDTSALLPYYREEALSDTVQALLQATAGRVTISNLVEVEMASALARWVRMQEFSESDALQLQGAFEQDRTNGCFSRLVISPRHLDQARTWLLARSTGLRTLDALHLACAWDGGAELVTADRLMAEAADVLRVGCRLLA